MTIKEARRICEAKGLCLCGHFETCSVCTRPDSVRQLERKAELVLRKAGCGINFKHDVGYANICRLCGRVVNRGDRSLTVKQKKQ